MDERPPRFERSEGGYPVARGDPEAGGIDMAEPQGNPAEAESARDLNERDSFSQDSIPQNSITQDLTARNSISEGSGAKDLALSASSDSASASSRAPSRALTQAPSPAPRRFFLNWPRLAASFYTLYSKLVGLRYEGYPFDLEGPCIFIIWHSEELSLLPKFGEITKGTIIISNSKDGDILSGVVARWGYPVIRGSSSKGAVRAVLALKRTLEAGNNIILAVDGPRGPRHEAKNGAFWLAAKTGRPICPVGSAISRAHVFRKSWSRSRLPLPFSKVAVSFGDLVWLGKKDLELDSDSQRAFLTSAMGKAMEDAERLLKNWPGNCSNCGKRHAGPDS